MEVRSDEKVLKIVAEEIYLRYIRRLKWTRLGGYWIWKEVEGGTKSNPQVSGLVHWIVDCSAQEGLIIQELRSSHSSLFWELIDNEE